MNRINPKLISNSQAADAILLVGFSSKNDSMRAMFSSVTAIGAFSPLVPVSGDASCGVEALDEPFEGILVWDCMMI